MFRGPSSGQWPCDRNAFLTLIVLPSNRVNEAFLSENRNQNGENEQIEISIAKTINDRNRNNRRTLAILQKFPHQGEGLFSGPVFLYLLLIICNQKM